MTRVLPNALILALTIGSLAILAARVIYPTINGYDTVIIHGNSMEPTIPFGSLAYIQHIEQPTTGMIVTYQSGTETVTHRLATDVSGNADFWETKGDANDKIDPVLIRNDQIIGQAVAYVPVMGLITNLLSQPTVIAFVLLVALSITFWPMLFAPTKATQREPA